MFRLIVLVLAGTVVPVAPGSAQTCVGRSSFREGRIAVGGALAITEGTTGLGVYGTYGTRRSWFGGATIGATVIGGGLGTSRDLGASLGYQVPIGRSLAQFCPYAFAGNSELKGLSTNTYGFGGSLGWRYEDSPGLEIVPAVGLQWRSRGSALTAAGTVVSPSRVGVGSMSLGFVAGQQWSVVPGASRALSSGADWLYTFSIGYNFGK